VHSFRHYSPATTSHIPGDTIRHRHRHVNL
jgi:hypothetical protein